MLSPSRRARLHPSPADVPSRSSQSADNPGMRPLLAPPPSRPVEPLSTAPTFSVVVACFDVAHVVRDAIDSLLGQTLAPHEVVVVDDGSSDDIVAVLRDYGDRIVFVQHPQNRGAAAAMNTGAPAAT